MKTKEKLSKVSEVVHYLYGCIRRSNGINDLLPGESELCRKFGFARGTVQRAVNGLMKNNYIIKKPGRHGLYINPEMAGLVPVAIGVGVLLSVALYVASSSSDVSVRAIVPRAA